MNKWISKKKLREENNKLRSLINSLTAGSNQLAHIQAQCALPMSQLAILGAEESARHVTRSLSESLLKALSEHRIYRTGYCYPEDWIMVYANLSLVPPNSEEKNHTDKALLDTLERMEHSVKGGSTR